MAQYFEQSFIEKVKGSCDIVEVISKYIPLKQKGRTFWGNCPFHHESEPSFAVSPEGQFFNCFGCHVGGSVITFVSKYESLTFTEALKLLAKQNNIELPQGIDEERIKRDAEQKKKILEINLLCAKFYNSVLMSDRGIVAREYLYKRELNNNILIRFGLGYSPDWDSLVKYLREKNISLEDGVKAGVLGKKNGKYFDFFAERIIFPIISSTGDVLGFSARVTTKEHYGGKYKNSPDSVCFNKSNIVYAINLLKKACHQRKVEYAIICEGQMDVIALNKSGFDNAIACMGTALTPQHAKEIKRYVDKVIVCFDGDSAGIKATIRSLDILDKAGLAVYVLTLKDGLDPDEYIKMYGKESFEKLLDENIESKNDYKYNTILRKYNLSNNKEKSDFINEVLEFINSLNTSSEKEIYLKQVQDVTKLSLDSLKNDLNRQHKQEKKKIFNNGFKEVKSSEDKAYTDALDFVFASYLHGKYYATKPDIQAILSDSFYSILINALQEIDKNNANEIDNSYNVFAELKKKFGENDENLLRLENYYQTEKFNMDNPEQYYKDCLKKIKLKEKELELKILQDDIATMVENENQEEKREKILKLDKILKEIRKLKSEG